MSYSVLPQWSVFSERAPYLQDAASSHAFGIALKTSGYPFALGRLGRAVMAPNVGIVVRNIHLYKIMSLQPGSFSKC